MTNARMHYALCDSLKLLRVKNSLFLRRNAQVIGLEQETDLMHSMQQMFSPTRYYFYEMTKLILGNMFNLQGMPYIYIRYQ